MLLMLVCPKPAPERLDRCLGVLLKRKSEENERVCIAGISLACKMVMTMKECCMKSEGTAPG